jgi:peptidoglycan/xylan/chitin deacetylase (PgdA/CDA1 family)
MSYETDACIIAPGHIVGSHTMTHPNMAYVDTEVARQEMTESKQGLERELGAGVRHFAYPCPALLPHWTEQTVAQTVLPRTKQPSPLIRAWQDVATIPTAEALLFG